ncbi:MAG: 30S ribosomal protein S12 methylthiotransferase RimO [Clostridia bacterium]|nr:30S ribosomal protein S12 methylthiotransferase RimO [Clostridia bacterium]
MNLKNKLVGVVSLGCDKNRVDTEVMLTYLRDEGIKFTADPKSAHIIIVNTCAFIESARKEAIETIAEMLRYKKIGNCEKLIVTGCMPQKYLNILQEEFPKVDVFIGIDDYSDIANIIKKSYESDKQFCVTHDADVVYHVKNRVTTTPMHYAYLKIADGCDNYCTFCTIPYIRGKYRSKKISELVEEAQDLVHNGARELILVAQDVTKYGIDLYGKINLVGLIKRLSKIENLDWIRLLYCYPENVTKELLDEMVNNPKLVNYLDIPLQHISDNVLKLMNRHVNEENTIKLIEKINSMPEKVYIRTTFMVGFPGETQADHDKLCKFIKKYKLAHVGFFEYSREEGTVAAKMPNQVPQKVKHAWLKELIKIA